MNNSLFFSRSIVAFVASFFCAHLHASPGDLIALMDAFCIGADGDVKSAEKMAIASGGKRLSKDMLHLDPAVARDGGSGFTVVRGKKKYVVMITNKGACSILSVSTLPQDLKLLLEKTYPLRKVLDDGSGPQFLTMWKVLQPSMYAGSVISMNAAKSGFGADGAVSLGYLSSKLVQAEK